MNKIEEKRSEIINDETRNTAQNDFLTMLKYVDANHATEIRVDVPLHGDLDFSVLKDRDFRKVKTIIIGLPGEITEIRNIPEGVTKLTCQNQMIQRVTQLPSTLEEADFTGNVLTQFDAKDLLKLRVLKLSDNELSTVSNLPPTLEILECENNQLRRLNLSSTPALKTLYCSNNPLLMLEHVPPTLSDIKMENTPFTEISRRGENEDEKRADKHLEYVECLQEYFRLKREYETKAKQLRKKAYEQTGSTNKKIQREQVKVPCISCKRKVGTLFKNQNGKYIAMCGDKEKPCSLDIQLFKGSFIPLEDQIDLFRRDIEDSKEKIIVQKMDTLFNYVDEKTAIDDFQRILKDFQSSSVIYKKFSDKYADLFENETRKLQRSRKQAEIYKILEDVEKMKEEYEKTGNHTLLVDFTKLQVDDLIPAIQQLRNLTFDTMYVEEDLRSGKSILKQRAIAFEKSTDPLGEPSRVIKYVYNV